MIAISKPVHDGSLPRRQRANFKEEHLFILEAAEQYGFKPIDDLGTLYQVTDEWLVDFVARIVRQAYDNGAMTLGEKTG